MGTQDFLSSVAVILAVMGVAAAIELAAPLHAESAGRGPRRRANMGVMAVTLLFNWALTSAVAVFALAMPAGPGLLRALPTMLEIPISIVALDFAYGYLAHRLMHEVPALWRIHRVHHSDEFVDVTTTYRNHPAESAWRYPFLVGTAWVLGSSATAVVAARLLSVVNATFEHANLRLPARVDTMLSSFWVTPNMHKVHHSRDVRETDTNYSNILSIHDRLFGTFTPTARALHVEYGVDDVPAETTTLALLTQPFRSATARPAGAEVSTA